MADHVRTPIRTPLTPRELRAPFSLREKLSILLVICLFIAVVALSLVELKKSNRASSCSTDLLSVTTAISGYYARHNFYPASNTQLQHQGFLPDGVPRDIHINYTVYPPRVTPASC